MMARVLRTELRRSSAPWTAALVALFGAVMLYVILRAWGGRWMNLALFQREYLFVLVPFALGAGAWQARRESRSKVGELFGSTSRARWQRMAPTAGAMAVAVTVGYLAMFAAGAVQVAPNASYVAPGTAPVVAVGVLAMVAAVWLGLAVGTLLPSPFTAPVLVVAGVVGAAFWLPGAGRRSALLTGGLSRAPDDFSDIATSVHVGQALWLVALAVAALMLLGASGPRGRVAAVAPAVLGLVAALAVLPGDREDIVAPDARAASLVCTPDAPDICVTRVHEAALADVRGPAREALRILAAKLPDAPTSAAEATVSWIDEPARPAPPGVLLMDFMVDARGRLDASADELLTNLLEGGGTRPCANIFDLPGRYAVARHHAARAVAAAWLRDEAPPPNFADLVVEGYAALRALPAAEQHSRVVALRDAAAACDGRDLLDILTPGLGRR